jgi:hypothetical protein
MTRATKADKSRIFKKKELFFVSKSAILKRQKRGDGKSDHSQNGQNGNYHPHFVYGLISFLKTHMVILANLRQNTKLLLF